MTTTTILTRTNYMTQNISGRQTHEGIISSMDSLIGYYSIADNHTIIWSTYGKYSNPAISLVASLLVERKLEQSNEDKRP
ncbi:MAG: hypothetical protein WBV22_05810 [Anaerolineaceae bacterium]